MADNRGMILWTLGGAGVFLIYAAYKNQNPQTLLLNHLNGSADSNPISVPTAPVPTAVDNQGKSWNTAPGDGGYVSTDPPTPAQPYGSSNAPMMSYGNVAPDLNGQYNVIDGNGLIIASVPNAYQRNASSYIPAVNV